MVDILDLYGSKGGARAPDILNRKKAEEAYKAAGGIDREIDDWSAYAPRRSAGEIIGDVATVGRDAASVGFGAKADAKLDEKLAGLNYDESIARRRQEIKDAGERLGPTGKFLAEFGGGAMTGVGLGRMGATILGRIPGAAPLWQKMAGGAVEGAGYGAAHGAGHTDDGNYVENMGKGAVGGGVLGAAAPVVLTAAQRVLTPFPMINPQGRGPLIQTADDIGLKLSAGDRTGSPKLRTFEDASKKLPGGGFFGGSRTDSQMEDVTQEAMRRSGISTQPGMVATPDVLSDAKKRIGADIGAIQKTQPIPVDNQMLADIVKIDSDDIPRLLPGQQQVVRHFLNKLTSNHTLDPELASSTRTQLNDAISAQNGPSGDSVYGGVLIELKKALDTGLVRALASAGRDADVPALQALRQQYANLHTLIGGIGSSSQAGQRGVLTPTALATSLSSAVGKGNYVTGVGDLNDVARMSAGLLRPPPDSGTATRLNLTEPMAILRSPLALVNRWPLRPILGNQVAPQPMSGAAMAPVVSGAAAAGETGNPAGPVREIIEPATRDLIERARHLRALLRKEHERG